MSTRDLGIQDGVEKAAATALQKVIRRMAPELPLRGGHEPDVFRKSLAEALRSRRSTGHREEAKKLLSMTKSEYGNRLYRQMPKRRAGDHGGILDWPADRPKHRPWLAPSKISYISQYRNPRTRARLLSKRREHMMKAIPGGFGQGVS